MQTIGSKGSLGKKRKRYTRPDLPAQRRQDRAAGAQLAGQGTG